MDPRGFEPRTSRTATENSIHAELRVLYIYYIFGSIKFPNFSYLSNLKNKPAKYDKYAS